MLSSRWLVDVRQQVDSRRARPARANSHHLASHPSALSHAALVTAPP